MSRRRYISTQISIDAAVNKLAQEYSDFAALFYTWMIPHADDQAMLTGDPDELMYTVIPRRRDKTIDDITEALGAMEELGLIYWDRANKIIYLPTSSFYKYQTYIKQVNRRSEVQPEHRTSPQNTDEHRKTPTNTDDQRTSPEITGKHRYHPHPLTLSLPLSKDVVVDDRAREENSAINLVATWEKQTGRPVNPVEAQKIQAYVEDDGLEPEVVAEAMTRAALQNKNTMAYVDGILKNWIATGARTMTAVQALDVNYEQSKQIKHDRKQPRAEPRGQDAVDAYLKSLAEVEQHDDNTS